MCSPRCAAKAIVVGEAPDDSAAMMDLLQEGPTNALDGRASRIGGVAWPLADYKAAFAALAGERAARR